MREGNGGIANLNTFETINAAAAAIESAESRALRATVQKRRWVSCWSISWCFGSQKHSKRTGHAVLVPEPTPNQTDVPAIENTIEIPTIIVPLVAPPSSPASFLPSEPPSAVQSPVGVVSLTSTSANMYSPGSPRSIFVIGPYAHETQLVSPPVFSSFTTEPSTAPLTPPESVHLTTPSSPEVPFAQLLGPTQHSNDVSPRYSSSHFEYLNYHLHPGSPVGQLISPGSAISGSGTSSPFPDPEPFAAGLYFPDIYSKVPPKLLSLELPYTREGGPQQGSGSLTTASLCSKPCDSFLLQRQNSKVSPLPNFLNGSQQNEASMNHRVSFVLTSEDDVRCVEEPKELHKAEQNAPTEEKDEISSNSANAASVGETSGDGTERAPADGDEGQQSHRQRSMSLGSVKEFNFDSLNGDYSHKPCIGSNWWATEEAVGKGGESSNNWSFPMLQPDVS